MRRILECLPLLALLVASPLLAAPRQTQLISGTVLLADQQADHSGTTVRLELRGAQTPAPFLAVGAALLLVLPLLRRRWRPVGAAAVVLGASALALAGSLEDLTGPDGAFQLSAPGGAFTPGTYSLEFLHAGYAPQSRQVSLTEDGPAELVLTEVVTLEPLAPLTPSPQPSPTQPQATPTQPQPSPTQPQATPTQPQATPTITPTLAPGVSPQDGTFEGTTSQGRTIRIVVLDSKIIQASVGGGTTCLTNTEVTNFNCPVTSNGDFSGCRNHSFACEPAGPPQITLGGHFSTSTSASGTLGVANRPSFIGNCCFAPGPPNQITWSVTLSSR